MYRACGLSRFVNCRYKWTARPPQIPFPTDGYLSKNGLDSSSIINYILRVYHSFSWKSQRYDCPRIPRYHHPSSILKKSCFCSKRMCLIQYDLLRCYGFGDSKDLSRFHHPALPFHLKRSETPIVLDPSENSFKHIQNTFQTSEVPYFPVFEFRISKMLRYAKLLF